ncbi:glucosyltransferase [Neodidymelliopsis sp. IMI 364377]|nr:glucosyltransferase [Neodidymelliopsis sp. IMI 364377]
MFEQWRENIPNLAAAFFAVNIVAWSSTVNKDVPVPYLDEYFHVPQAQKYCNGDYSWDPKITTPPGLYLVAKSFSPIFGCSTNTLRLHNVLALILIFHTVLHIRRLIRARTDPQPIEKDSIKWTDEKRTQGKIKILIDGKTPVSNTLTAFNIASFPPLFFFGALYYTDVMSTAAVLLSYQAFLNTTTKLRSSTGNVLDHLITVSIGVVALFFRQTNIFWVAVFPAGLTVVEVLQENGCTSEGSSQKGFLAVLQESWSQGTIYDRTLQEAGFVFSVAALGSPIKILRSIASYTFLLVLFAGFVVWNGSVVLGDKSAHTATLHTPQMLYIWPYIALFSAPILLGPLIQCFAPLLPPHISNNLGVRSPHHFVYPQPLETIFFLSVGLAAVHYNTIIHPYTLADNRHYVFYVFRILLRYPILKYLAVPVYYICAWLSTRSLAYPAVDPAKLTTAIHPKLDPKLPGNRRSPTQISFVIIWLVTTALSVVTAPLVEPRYFIIPWIIWRLHIPHAPTLFTFRGRTYSPDLRVVFETVWVLVINAAVHYLFLHRTFTWPSEPGNVQRFLW